MLYEEINFTAFLGDVIKKNRVTKASFHLINDVSMDLNYFSLMLMFKTLRVFSLCDFVNYYKDLD